MAWIKLDDGFFRNPKIVAISAESKLIYLAGLCYAGAALTDGFIPKNAVKMLASDASVASPFKRAKELVDAGLWIENPRGYDVHDYLEHNSSASDVIAKREAARKRMEAKRAGSSHEVRTNTSRSSRDVQEPDTDTEVDPEIETENSLSQEGEEEPFLRDVSRSDELEQRFDQFWAAYPRKTAKGDARKVWKRIRPSASLTQTIVEAVERQKKTKKWKDEGGRFIPYPATWLNREEWENEIAAADIPVRRHVV